MKAISGSHALLTNIVLAWNTARMHEVVERLRARQIPVEDEWLRRIGPAHFSHVNFRGTMRFGVEKFAAALIQRVRRARQRGWCRDEARFNLELEDASRRVDNRC